MASIRLWGASALAVTCLAAAPAAAQQSGADDSYLDRPNSLTIGVGAAYLPSYEGSDDYEFTPVALAFGKVAGFSFATRGSSLSADLIRSGSDAPVTFQVGPLANLRLNRSSRIRDPQVRALGKIKRAVELGGYAGLSFNKLLDPYDSLSFRISYKHDVSGVHRDGIWEPTLEYQTPVSTRTFVMLSGSAERVGDRFARTYFSVTPAGSLRSGLPVYNAHGGWKNVRATLMLGQALTGDLRHPGLSLFAGVSYGRMLGNFRRSPIVSVAGSPNQYLATAGLAYSF
ncbi:MAG: MipA family protein [Sphingomonadales bacterium]|nr:MipA family protein [Sphingomonadales bacterium]